MIWIFADPCRVLSVFRVRDSASQLQNILLNLDVTFIPNQTPTHKGRATTKLKGNYTVILDIY